MNESNNPLAAYAVAANRAAARAADLMTHAPHAAFSIPILSELGTEERALLAMHVLARRAWREAVRS